MCCATVDLTVQCVGQLKLLVDQMVQNWVFEGNNSKNSSISLLGLNDVYFAILLMFDTKVPIIANLTWLTVCPCSKYSIRKMLCALTFVQNKHQGQKLENNTTMHEQELKM